MKTNYSKFNVQYLCLIKSIEFDLAHKNAHYFSNIIKSIAIIIIIYGYFSSCSSIILHNIQNRIFSIFWTERFFYFVSDISLGLDLNP